VHDALPSLPMDARAIGDEELYKQKNRRVSKPPAISRRQQQQNAAGD